MPQACDSFDKYAYNAPQGYNLLVWCDLQIAPIAADMNNE